MLALQGPKIRSFAIAFPADTYDSTAFSFQAVIVERDMIASSRVGWYRLFALGLCLLAAKASGQVFEEFMGAPPPARNWLTDDQVAPAALFQPPALSQSTDPVRSPAPSRSLASRQRLASVPNMFGDFGMTVAVVQFVSPQGVARGAFSVPGAGGSRRVKIGENNSPIPTDRAFFMYNHFHNAYQFQEINFTSFPPTLIQRQNPIDRFTLGVEKTFFDGDWSVEVRLPIVASLAVQGETFAVEGGNWGNLAVIVKRLLYADDNVALAAGLGIDAPTGSDFESQFGGSTLRFENDALHLLPYVGVVVDPGYGLFLMGYMQIDIATAGNDVLFGPQGSAGQSVGRFNEQNLMYFDVGGGYWLYENPYGECVTGVAALLEFHYTTAIQDTDEIAFGQQFTNAFITTPGNRFDVVNVSAGVNVAFGEWSNLRVAGVFPLGDDFDQRFFDAEVQVQYNQRF